MQVRLIYQFKMQQAIFFVLIAIHVGLWTINGVHASTMSLPISSLENLQPATTAHRRTNFGDINQALHSRYVVIIDAGSTGSRVHIYLSDSSDDFHNFTAISHKRFHPGLSSFSSSISSLRDYLSQMVNYALKYIPTTLVSTTALSLKATAGMRVLNEEDQIQIIDSVRDYFFTSTQFLVDQQETRVISGEEEAMYLFLAIRISLTPSLRTGAGIAVADLGSSSKQLAYISTADNNSTTINDTDTKESCPSDWKLDNVAHTASSLLVSAKSVPGMGLIAAMDTVIGAAHSQHDTCHNRENRSCNVNIMDSRAEDFNVYAYEPFINTSPKNHPCFSSTGLDEPTYDGRYVTGDETTVYWLTGVGNFDACLQTVRETLLPTLHAGLNATCFQSQRSKDDLVVAVDNFAKLMEMLTTHGAHEVESTSNEDGGLDKAASAVDNDRCLHDVGKAISPDQIAVLGRQACSVDWRTWLSKFPAGTPEYRSQRTCFGAAYIYSMLVDIYGIDPDDNTLFVALDSINSFEVSWALGVAIASVLDKLVITPLITR